MMSQQFVLITFCFFLLGCSGDQSQTSQVTEQKPIVEAALNPVADTVVYGRLENLTEDVSHNPVAYIPPQCYTNPKTEGKVTNPCYVCHSESKEPNFINDDDVQLNYSFPEAGVKNHWSNVFKDRSDQIENLSDEEILKYVRKDNYLAPNGGIILAEKLSRLPSEWDRNKNGQWDGYIPDVYFSFNESGFDQAPNGEFTGWRAYAYYPFPGTFMPTNGSMDDVLIRLPQVFREREAGRYDETTYKINLAIIEALLKEKTISIEPVDEAVYGVDLNKNGVLDQATEVEFAWAPQNGITMSYVGMAKLAQEQGQVHLAKRLYPEGTEFIHSVRYLDVSASGVQMSSRMKELRYSRKNSWRNFHQLRTIFDNEVKERHDFPDRTKTVTGNMETGLNVPQGWTYQGFIEDNIGELRPQTYEETYFCTGCHGYTGASHDTTLSFARKLDDSYPKQGWFHWKNYPQTKMFDPKREDGLGEFAFYLEQNPTGNEFRNNEFVLSTFYSEDGSKKASMFKALNEDLRLLLLPSKERALILNKAYKLIVEEQSFTLGRDAVIHSLESTVHKEVIPEQETGITEVLSYF